MFWFLLYLLGVIATFGVVVLDDTRGTFRDVYDKAYGVDSKAALEKDHSTRGWTATWISFLWPITMPLFVCIMLVACFIVHVARPNPFNVMYDKVSEWLEQIDAVKRGKH